MLHSDYVLILVHSHHKTLNAECHDNGKVALMWHFICAKTTIAALKPLVFPSQKFMLYQQFQFAVLVVFHKINA